MVVTDKYCISSFEYIKIILNRFSYLKYMFCTILILLIYLSFNDIRFALVSLMIVFIVIPLIMLFTYLQFAFAPQVKYSILEKTLEITDNGLSLHFETQNIAINWNEFSKLKLSSKHLLLEFKKGKHIYFIIPYDSFKSIPDFKEAVTTIKKAIQ